MFILIFASAADGTLHPTVPTPTEPDSNILYLDDDDNMGGLYLGSFKTSGVQKIPLGKVQSTQRAVFGTIYRQ